MSGTQALTSSRRSTLSEIRARNSTLAGSLHLRTDASVSVPLCKRTIRARYALANSNRSVPHSDSSARGRSPKSFALSRMRNRPAAGNLIEVYLLTARKVGSANFALTGIYEVLATRCSAILRNKAVYRRIQHRSYSDRMFDVTRWRTTTIRASPSYLGSQPPGFAPSCRRRRVAALAFFMAIYPCAEKVLAGRSSGVEDAQATASGQPQRTPQLLPPLRRTPPATWPPTRTAS
jgi:hypothetical protein